jgi:flagellar basal-body rod modification protein FlgD
MKQDLGMNSDDFLKLFIAQLQNQDPLAPQDPTQFLGQLAQISQVEQAYNTNTALQNLIAMQNNSTSMNSVSFIGKTVKASGNAVSFDGTNPASVQFSLSAPIAAGNITISDATGKVVRTASLGVQPAGDVSLAWDGRDNNGATLPAGAYSFAVSGATSSGSAVTATTYTSGLVSAVSRANGTPSLVIGAATVPLANVISVGA